MANIIEGRVMQKKDTEANWLVNPLPLLSGEQAFVVTATGQPMNFKIGDGVRTFAQLPYWIKYDQAAWVSITGTVLPSQPAGTVKYSLLGAGTYTQTTGGSIVIPAGNMSTVTWNGTNWVKGDNIPLPVAESITDWTAQAYAIGKQVYYAGNIWVLSTAAVAGDVPGVSAKWVKKINAGVKNWEPKVYYGGDQVYYNGSIYELSAGAVAQPNQNPYNSTLWENKIYQKYDNIVAYKADYFLKSKGFDFLNSTVNISTSLQNRMSDVIRLKAGETILMYGSTRSLSYPALLIFNESIENDSQLINYPAINQYSIISYTANIDCYVIAQYQIQVDNQELGWIKHFGNKEIAPLYSKKNIYKRLDDVLTWEVGALGFNNGVNVNDVTKNYSTPFYVKKGQVFCVKNNSNLSGNGGMVRLYTDSKKLQGLYANVREANQRPTTVYYEVKYNGFITFVKNVISEIEIYEVLNFEKTDPTYSFDNTPLFDTWGYGITISITGLMNVINGFLSFTPFIPVKAGDIIDTRTLTYGVYFCDKDSINDVSAKGYFLAPVESSVVNTAFKVEGQPEDYSVMREVLNFKHIAPFDGYIVAMSNDYDTIVGLKYKILNFENYLKILSNQKIDLFEKEKLNIDSIKFLRLETVGLFPQALNQGPYWYYSNLFDGNKLIAQMYNTFEVQGHGSSQYPKKGFTFEPYNKYGKSLSIKFNDMAALDSFHLKAYYTDSTQSRDVGNGRLWYEIARQRSYPNNLIHNKTTIMESTMSNENAYDASARFFTDGVPTELVLNNYHYGLYTMRMKKHRANYGMDRNDLKHIFLDSAVYETSFTTGFNYTQWELRNPKLSGYDGEMTPIPAGETLNNINRFFNWLRDSYNNVVDMRTTYADYIVLEAWIDWLIIGELIGNWDTNGNNANWLTWDGIHWSPCLYDTDSTIGIKTNSQKVLETESGMIVTNILFIKMKTVFAPEIKARYKQLRDNKTLTNMNFIKIYRDSIMAYVPSSVYASNYDKWGGFSGNKLTDRQIMKYLNYRINYLDSQWGS